MQKIGLLNSYLKSLNNYVINYSNKGLVEKYENITCA